MGLFKLPLFLSISTTLLCAVVVRTAVCFSAEDCSGIPPKKWSEEPPHSCLEIKQKTKTERDGLYSLQTKSGQSYQAFCDMNTNGGGWTLVASVHENNIAAKCTTGDRWTSQQGSNSAVPFIDGDKNWANLNTFGVPESATDDDYKNPGYYDLEANDIAVWHVPNGTPLPAWKTSSLFRYHTESKFLAAFGGSFYSFFKNFFPLTYNSGSCPTNNGPAYPIVYDYGSDAVVNSLSCPNCLSGTTSGFVQFRVFNNERAPFAICSGLKVVSNCDTEHFCVGGGGYVPQESPKECGDFGAFDWNGYGTGVEWSASKKLLESAILIYYR
uniref:Intelectin-1b-like n=1 Tax=Petromyzon marinus TaxID=7757 RepID=A0AAJ7U9Z2_PETMA|nr:intelectin-1b-like [Petromyzon marinus]